MPVSGKDGGLALFFTDLARVANSSVDCVSAADACVGQMVAIMIVFALPPSESCGQQCQVLERDPMGLAAPRSISAANLALFKTVNGFGVFHLGIAVYRDTCTQLRISVVCNVL